MVLVVDRCARLSREAREKTVHKDGDKCMAKSSSSHFDKLNEEPVKYWKLVIDDDK